MYGSYGGWLCTQLVRNAADSSALVCCADEDGLVEAAAITYESSSVNTCLCNPLVCV